MQKAVLSPQSVRTYCGYLYRTLNIIIRSAVKYGMREMEVEVRAAEVGAFGGLIRYIEPPEALQ